MKLNKPLPRGFSASNKKKIALYLGISIICWLSIWLSTNFLASQWHSRIHLTSDGNQSLSPFTHQILDLVEDELEIILYFNPDTDVFQSLEILTREYTLSSKYIRVNHVDHESDPAQARVVRDEFKLAFAGEKDAVLIKYQNKYRAILEKELSILDVNPLLQGTSKEIKRSAFKGEQALTSAILSLVLSDEKKVTFIEGHQEFSPKDTSDQIGYSRYAESLERNLCNISSQSLSGTNSIPEDTSLVVIANPSSPYTRQELRKLAGYLESGGRVLAFIGSKTKTGLEPLFATYGIGLSDNVLLDVARSSNPSGTDMTITNFNAQPMMRPLYEGQLYMVMPRSVHSLEGLPNVDTNLTMEVLMQTSTSAQEITQYEGNRLIPTAQDRVGEFPLAVLSSKNVESNQGQKVARLLVVGESLFMANTGIQSLMNYDFGIQAANYLMDRGLFINNIPPRPVKEYELILTNGQKLLIRWLLILIFPGIFLILGFFIYVKKSPKD